MSPSDGLEYVLPLAWSRETSVREADQLGRYLHLLAELVDVTVVDGSPTDVFDRHHERWAGAVRHVRPAPRHGANGKVAGVVTGVQLARHDRVIVADDDVRYDAPALALMARALETADVVRPQCIYDSGNWCAQWDSARILVNRSLGHDYPGTYGVRAATFRRAGGYDGDALFENLEMVRTLRVAGAVVSDRPDLFVRRTAPSLRQFWGQRVRQAYDSFAQPARLAGECALLPAFVLSVRARPRLIALWVAAPVLLAEVGRRRHRGRREFSWTCSLWAPVWVAERAVCVWLAVWQRLRGGVRYRGCRVRLAAHSTAQLRARLLDPQQRSPLRKNPPAPG
jgi:hypothetical protein